MSDVKIGDYTITRELGRGGMGKVFQALSLQGATVAVKTMLLAEDPDARTRWETVERFQREARAARSLVHPNIVQVLDIGVDQDAFFIVMEFLDGQSLKELIEVAGAIRPERATEIMIAACEALAHAHDQGVVHRDIKPANIMVLRTGAVKLTDFGLAAIVTEKGVTQTGTMMGTYAYMSPEQARGEQLDARSDIFSLGATFYEMLTGHQPFPGETTALVLNKILTEDPAPIPGLPVAISRTLGKCLRRQPTYRYQNAGDIITDLRAAGAAAEPTGTVVLPGRAARPPAAPGKAAPASPSIPVRPPAKTGAAVFRCEKCRQPIDPKAAVCWKCGAPNAAAAQRPRPEKSRQAIRDALRGITPPGKKGGWFTKGR